MRILLGSGGFRTPERIRLLNQAMDDFFRGVERLLFIPDALTNEYNAIVQYNNALVGFEFAKGTIMQHDNVNIAEGPLPECAQERAVEHIRKRTNALILRERAAPPAVTAVGFKPGDPCPPTPPALPQLIQQVPPLKDAPALPAPGAATVPPLTEAKVGELLPAPTATQPADKGPAPAGKPALLPPSDFGSKRDLP